MNSHSVAFDLAAFLNQVVVSDMRHHELPFLQGRALWFASQLTSVLPADLLDTYVRASIEALSTQSLIVKIFAIKAITKCELVYLTFCSDVMHTEYHGIHSICNDVGDRTILNGYQGQILHGLANLTQSFVSTEEGMALILNCLLLAIKVELRNIESHKRMSPLIP